MYKFSLPDSLLTRSMNKVLLYAIREYREWFYDDFVIDSVYGCPNSIIWNGGRNQGYDKSYIPPDEYFNSIVGMYRNNFGVSYRATFTNCMLEPVHLLDTYANKFAAILNSFGSNVIVSLPLMAEYIQARYKKLQICWSTTTNYGKTIEEQVEKINELSKTNIVVVPYWFNNKWEIIAQLKHPENIEFLANEVCVDNCPERINHYRSISKYNLFEELIPKETEYFVGGCPMQRKFPKLFEQPRKHEINREMISIYVMKGFNLFKLEGRNDTNDVNLLNRYLLYFLNPKYLAYMQNFYNECVQTDFARFR